VETEVEVENGAEDSLILVDVLVEVCDPVLAWDALVKSFKLS
jgi:hypothetical protein